METKTCTKCHQTKVIEDFYAEHRSHCKDCERRDARYRMASLDNKIRTAYRDSKKTARRFGVYDDLTLDDVFYTFAISGGCCNYCGKLAGRDLQLEHILAMSTGGHNTLANMTTSCKDCKLKKRDESLLAHLQTNSFDDIELISTLIDRVAYRLGVHRMEVVDILEQQQQDYTRRKVMEIMERTDKD